MDGLTIIITFAKRLNSTIRKTIEDYGRLYSFALAVYMVVMMFDLYPSCLVCSNNWIKVIGIVVLGLVYGFYNLYCNRFGGQILKTEKTEIKKSVEAVLVGGNHENPQQTMVYIFIWTPGIGGNIGHASLQLWNDSMTYISHWPAKPIGAVGDPRKKLEVPAINNHLLGDLRAEANYVREREKYPDILIIIPDKFFTKEAIENINKFNEERLNKIEPRYKLKFENCADVVQDALAAGGFKLVNPIPRIMKLGLSAPTDISDRIVYTFVMKNCNSLIRNLHSVFEFLVLVTYIYIAKVCLHYIGDFRIASVAPSFMFVLAFFLFTVTRRN